MTALAPPQLTPLPKSRSRKAKNVLATLFISLAFLLALIPLVFLVVYVVQQGSKVISWNFLTEDLPFVDRLAGRWHGAGGGRHAAHHRCRVAHGHPARDPRRHLPQRVRRSDARWRGSSASSPR